MLKLHSKIKNISLWIYSIGILSLVIHFGFKINDFIESGLMLIYITCLLVGIVSIPIHIFLKFKQLKPKVIAIDIAIWILLAVVLYGWGTNKVYGWYFYIFNEIIFIKILVAVLFIRQVAESKLNLKNAYLNPAQIFIFSFLLIIFIGAGLLILPNSTYQGISFIDALFTSTSAVCVTGLIVVDTGSFFTPTGQLIILVLIQTGGLGILTFASYFSYFFTGGTSYKNQLALSDITSSQKLGEVFSTLKNIIIITVGIEFFAAVLIYFSVTKSIFGNNSERLFFAIFHSISAFCNAGFSTFTNGLYENSVKFNYALQLVIVFTFVFGGLGFPIVVNIIKYIKYKFMVIVALKKKQTVYKPWVLNLNSRLNLITTLSITIISFCVFLLLEHNNTLTEHSFAGKIVGALFGATTPRTAGFNNIHMSALKFSTIMLVMLLMWIGASPQSTGGGIKTSTFGIAILNILSIAKGKTRIEIFRREIAEISVKRAFAIITLSFFVIGLGIIFLTYTDGDKTLLQIAFECFSAYSTVGLSLGITANLSIAGKFIIIVIMFIGRISMLSLVIAVFIKTKYKYYQYPKEEITIN
ncbi:MAG: TrkH family potassium uptake protein [Bacteroidia bacterium]